VNYNPVEIEENLLKKNEEELRAKLASSLFVDARLLSLERKGNLFLMRSIIEAAVLRNDEGRSKLN